MNWWRFDLSALADISTNIFAVFILILIIMLDQSRVAVRSGADQSAAGPIDAARDLRLVARSPQRADDLIDMLHRRNAPGALVIDLFDSRIEVSRDNRRPAVVLDARRDSGRAIMNQFETLIRETGGTSAQLYVFSNWWYGQVIDKLSQAGVNWSELSVPMALRSSSGPAAGSSWSAGFLELVSRSLDRDRFREGLARLLAGSASGTEMGGSLGKSAAVGGASQANAPTESLKDRIGRILGWLVEIVALSLAIAAVGWIEWSYPRALILARQQK